MKKLIFYLTFNLFLVLLTIPAAWAEESGKLEKFSVSTQEKGGDYSYYDSQGVVLKGRQQISQYHLNYQADERLNLGLTMQVSRINKLEVDSPNNPMFSVDSNGHKLTLGAKLDYRLYKSGPWNTSLVFSYNQLPVSLYRYNNDNSRAVLDLDQKIFLLGLASEYQVSPRFTLMGEVGISPWKSNVDVDIKRVSADGSPSFQNFQYKAQTNSWLVKGKYKLDQRFTLTLGYRYLEIKGESIKEWTESPVKQKVNEWIIGVDVNLK